MPLSASQDSLLTLYCHSGNDQVLSIDPNSLAIIVIIIILSYQFKRYQLFLDFIALVRGQF
jgi:hypothetical protein